MGQKTQGPCHPEISHGVIYKLLMGGTVIVSLVRGTLGCPGEMKDHKQACAWLVVLATNVLID